MSKSRITSLVELVVLAAAVELVLWLLGPRLEGSMALVPIYWILVAGGTGWMLWWSPFRIHRDTPSRRGWRTPAEPPCPENSFAVVWPYYLGMTLALLLLVVAAGILRNGGIQPHLDADAFIRRLAGYAVFGPVQAMIFFGFALTRFRDILKADEIPLSLKKRRAAAGLAASYFSLLHYPNAPLMAATLIAGFFWANLFMYRPNIWAMGMCHAVLGTTLHMVVGISMRIGPFYDHPDQHLLRAVVPGLREFIGGRF